MAYSKSNIVDKINNLCIWNVEIRELRLAEGELQAKGRRRQIGWFPATYVKVLQGGRNSGRNTPVSGSRIEMTEQILGEFSDIRLYEAALEKLEIPKKYSSLWIYY